jgi:predicted amidophosphoribosyltransferase
MESYSVTSIVCPNCTTDLDPSDDICHQCGANTSSGVETRDGSRGRLIDRPWLLIVVLLHVGLLGIPMYWKTKYSTRVRLVIIAVSIAYTIFSLVIIIGMGMYIINNIRMLAT